ncbi:MAG: single-stranded DNA-binding protein [Firmicutes bacterium]|nr:single-stranded DNA-binding protein [Bacillota bacterium]
MNSVILIGNLTRDPELRYSTGMNQTAICRFTVAVNDGYGDKQRTSYIPIVVFNKQAENCDRYLAKGRKVAVNGRIQTGSYTNKEGNKVYTTEVIANNVEFLGGGNQDGGQGRGQDYGQQFGGYAQNQQAPQGGFGQEDPYQSGPAEDSSQGIPEGFQKIQDDDIPF